MGLQQGAKSPKQDQIGSTRFFTSVKDPGYKQAELTYVLHQVNRHYVRKTATQKKSNQRPRTNEIDTAINLIRVFRICWPDGYHCKPRLSLETADILTEGYNQTVRVNERSLFRLLRLAAELFGLDAIRVPWHEEREIIEGSPRVATLPLEDCPFPVLLNELGAAVCAFLRFCSDQARSGKPETKREAAKRMRIILESLVPDNRGKKRLTVDPSEVWSYYYRTLFCLQQIKHALKTFPGTRKEKIEAISKNFRIAAEDIREFIGLDSNNEIERLSGPYRIKDMARTLTGRHFGITSQTVSNKISQS